MLRALEIKNFTVFEEAKLEFSPGLNVVIGENGTGKSHLLKLSYALMKTHAMIYGQKIIDLQSKNAKSNIEFQLDQILFSIFHSEKLSNLISISADKNFCKIEGILNRNIDREISRIEFKILNSNEIIIQEKPKKPSSIIENLDVKNNFDSYLFIPTKEILSTYFGFAAALRNRELAFDVTYLDLADALALTPLKGERAAQVKPIIETLEKQMDGKVVVENGRFYISTDNQKLEMPLVAEGIRKIAMLAYLLMNGSLQKGTTFFWDEPETNLNPKMIRHLAETLVVLSSMGIQIVLATHSLFLLRELQIQLALNPNVPANFFALEREGKSVKVQQGNSIYDVDPIAALEADLEQTDRYLELT